MPKAIDLTGQTFGEITVLCKDEELSREKKRVYWKCRCSCGREKSIRGDGLKKIQTCGECKKDLTGQRFGRLIALKKGKKDKAEHQFWFCKCDCGNIVEVNGDNLRRGLTQSCGCLQAERAHQIRFKDLSGQRFGKLIVIPNDYIIEEPSKKAKWHCKCDCGNDTWVTSYSLTSGGTQSCGCISSSIGESNIAKILEDNDVEFYREFTFLDLPNRRYDFYLPALNRLIEFDGEQHTNPNRGWNKTEENFRAIQQRDKEKNEYATQHNIDLIRIPYYERDKMTLELLLGDKYKIT